MNKGIWYGLGAYGLWGLFPIYFKWLQHVPALQVVSHRIVWSCAILGGVILLTRRWGAFWAAACSSPAVRAYGAAAALIGVNWLVWVWAVGAGYIVQASLGYFITPLINVLLGVVFLRERLRPWQWGSVALAGTGVLWLAFAHGSTPWIGLTLALTFGTYGLVKKTAPLGSVHGLAVETGILLLPALLYLLYANRAGAGVFLHAGAPSDILLIGAGLVTAMPLLMFAWAAQRVPLSRMGVLQYISPTLQFLIGVLIYHEPFTRAQLIGFGLVWLALVIFVVEGVRQRRVPSDTVPI